jgi:hypothetical protein
VLTRFSGPVRKWATPILVLTVSKGHSTVCCRMRMAIGAASSRPCIASMAPSCSQRLIRRSAPVVHSDLVAQPWQAVVQNPPLFDAMEAPGQSLSSGTTVFVGLGAVDETRLSEAPLGLVA